MKKKPNKDIYIVVAVAIIAIIIMIFISMPKNVTFSKEENVTRAGSAVMTNEQPQETAQEQTIEEKNIAGRAFKLDECLDDCKEEVCRTNCVNNDGSLQPECFRNCIDECNNKCLKVYKW